MILWQPCAYFVLHTDVQFEISLKGKYGIMSILI